MKLSKQDEDLTKIVADALRDQPDLIIQIDVSTALCVFAALQLALRHPHYPPRSRPVTQRFAHAIQRQLAVTPEVNEALNRGWDERYDVVS